jgi:hypothetical protein
MSYGLSSNVAYSLDEPKKRAAGFKLLEGMDVPAELGSFKFARPRVTLKWQGTLVMRSVAPPLPVLGLGTKRLVPWLALGWTSCPNPRTP